MRDIKFRAWNEVLEKMYSWNEFLNTNMKQTFIAPESTAMILMQYTGLKDKNGNEIFEGDIVQAIYFNNSKSKKYVVKYDTDRAGFIPFACGDGCGCCETDVISVAYAEVIGNIYDNPELLKGEQS